MVIIVDSPPRRLRTWNPSSGYIWLPARPLLILNLNLVLVPWIRSSHLHPDSVCHEVTKVSSNPTLKQPSGQGSLLRHYCDTATAPQSPNPSSATLSVSDNSLFACWLPAVEIPRPRNI